MSSLKDQIEAAQRAVANWPADVKAAMGLDPTPSAEVIELRSKLQGCEKLLAAIMKASSMSEQRDIIARHKGLKP